MIVNEYLINGTLITVCVVLVIKLVQIMFDYRKLISKYKHLPQAPCNPIFGHLLEHPGPNDAGLAFQRGMTEVFPRFSLVWLCHRPMVFVAHPDLVKVILKSTGTNDAGLAFQREMTVNFPRFNLVWLAHRPLINVTHPDLVKIVLKSSEPKAFMTYRFVHPWLGEGLLTSNGNKWARNRRLLTPAFHFDILKDYIQLKNNLCNDLLSKFEKSSKTGVSLNVFDCISMFTLDVMLQSTMSYETGCQKEGAKHPYILAVNRMIKGVVDRFFKPWLHLDIVFYMTPTGISFFRDCRFVHQVADEIITRRRKELECGKVQREENENIEKRRKCQDFLDTLITARDEDGNGLTNREIRDEVDTFLFEGHDTTASAISWSLYSIAEHHDIQHRIQAEIDGLLEGRDSDYLLWGDMPKLPYLTMVIKESMRLHTPVPLIQRESTKDIVLDGFTVPTGSTLSLCIYNIHHNASVWEDSTKFDPERFSPTNVEKRDPFAFVPFSAGPRNCIGQNFAMDEIKIALVRILYRYEISLDPTHEVKKFEGMVMKAENDIKLRVKSRLP